MTYKFDIEKLNELLKDFYTLSKVTMSVWDSNFNQLTFYPKPMALICSKIKLNPEGKKMCLESDIAACRIAVSTKKPFTFTCHAGLIDTVVPIYNNDELIAYIMFGQIKDQEAVMSNIKNVKQLCKKYNIVEKEIEDDYKNIPSLKLSQINALSNLFKMCVPYFYTSKAIKAEENELASNIEQYILKNLNSKLSIEELCNRFRITVSTLYQISHKHFKTSIKDYIIIKRIEKAKHYLTTSQLSIYQICDKIGFNDYNFFIRTFKKRVGCTPLSYRKKFPLDIL